ncbi:MAG: hypothetical protein JNL38_36010 [Myxococcales bacterium]|nr:hypothetical protein [Myxococcales bacterium]
MRRKLPSLLLFAALVGLYACAALRSDELLCEEAAAHLVECCPGIQVERLNCDHDEGGCGTQQHQPDLRGDVAICLRDTACAQMTRPGGPCERARQASVTPEFLGTRDAFLGVCP